MWETYLICYEMEERNGSGINIKHTRNNPAYSANCYIHRIDTQGPPYVYRFRNPEQVFYKMKAYTISMYIFIYVL